MVDAWTFVSALIGLVLSAIATAHVLLNKRSVPAATGWVGLIWLAPLTGVVLYFLLGINRIRRRAASLRIASGSPELQLPSSEPASVESSQLALPSVVALRAYMDQLIERPLLPGNAIRLLENGDAAFPAMLDAIRGAERSIALSTYIFDAGGVGDEFIDALVEAKSRGVAVRVLIDAVGSRYSYPPAHRALRKRGVRTARFLPPFLTPWFNLRNHRKILVIDGRHGFTGGINIRDEHVVAKAQEEAIYDTHFEVRGPVVGHLVETFAHDWAFVTREVLSGEEWFPELSREGRALSRGISDGPDQDYERLIWTLLGAVGCAHRSVRVVTPYFLPEEDLATALNVAAMRGVEVEIILPGRSNVPLVQWAMLGQVRQVLGRGCRVYLADGPFDHSKLMVVDDTWVLLGSGNWDPRSLRINFEFNLEVYDAELARRVGEEIDLRVGRARLLRAEDLSARPLHLKLRDGVARLLMPYL